MFQTNPTKLFGRARHLKRIKNNELLESVLVCDWTSIQGVGCWQTWSNVQRSITETTQHFVPKNGKTLIAISQLHVILFWPIKQESSCWAQLMRTNEKLLNTSWKPFRCAQQNEHWDNNSCQEKCWQPSITSAHISLFLSLSVQTWRILKIWARNKKSRMHTS